VWVCVNKCECESVWECVCVCVSEWVCVCMWVIVWVYCVYECIVCVSVCVSAWSRKITTKKSRPDLGCCAIGIFLLYHRGTRFNSEPGYGVSLLRHFAVAARTASEHQATSPTDPYPFTTHDRTVVYVTYLHREECSSVPDVGSKEIPHLL